MLTTFLLLSLLGFSDPINLSDHGFSSALGRSSTAVTYDGELVIKEEDRFLVFRSVADAPMQASLAAVPAEALPGKGKTLRVIQNIVKVEGLYLVFAIILDEGGRQYGEVLTYSEDPKDKQLLAFRGFAKAYNQKKPPFLRNLVHGPDGKYFGYEMVRDNPDQVVFRWSQYLIKIDENNLPVFRKYRSSFFVNPASLSGMAGAFSRSWIAATPDGGKLISIDEVGDFGRLFNRGKGYQSGGNLPLSLDGFVSYKAAFPQKAQRNVPSIPLDRLQHDISKNTGLYSLEGMGDLFVLGYEVPTLHPRAKMALVLQVIDSLGTTLLAEEPIVGGLFAGLSQNQAVVLVPDLTTDNVTDYRVEMISFE